MDDSPYRPVPKARLQWTVLRTSRKPDSFVLFVSAVGAVLLATRVARLPWWALVSMMVVSALLWGRRLVRVSVPVGPDHTRWKVVHDILPLGWRELVVGTAFGFVVCLMLARHGWSFWPQYVPTLLATFFGIWLACLRPVRVPVQGEPRRLRLEPRAWFWAYLPTIVASGMVVFLFNRQEGAWALLSFVGVLLYCIAGLRPVRAPVEPSRVRVEDDGRGLDVLMRVGLVFAEVVRAKRGGDGDGDGDGCGCGERGIHHG